MNHLFTKLAHSRYGRSNITKEFWDFAKNKGIVLDKKTIIVPYYRNETLFTLALKESHMFTEVDIALMTWSAKMFNYLMSIYTDTSHVLLKYNSTYMSTPNMTK